MYVFFVLFLSRKSEIENLRRKKSVTVLGEFARVLQFSAPGIVFLYFHNDGLVHFNVENWDK